MKAKLSALTIFLGSFLVFGVQPMVGRTILPVFGGTASVWVVCLCAFQVLLLAGYFYAHRLSSCRASVLRSRHVPLLVVSAVATALAAVFRDKLLGGFSVGVPAIDVLISVILLTGFSYVLLSANSSLVQAVTGGEGVYRLYAVSNFGSLLGLLAYPFVFEPYVGLTHQWIGFTVGIVAYAALLWRLGGKSAECRVQSAEFVPADSALCTSPHSALYFALPAVSCFLLNALTTHVTLDIMPLPLIWTGSLALFLISYIIGFSGFAGRAVRPAAFLTLAFLIGVCGMNGHPLGKIGLTLAIFLYSGLLLCACTFLHSWLYLIRPGRSSLTRYYLFQSVGGAVGGVIASLAFPFLCSTVAEYPVSLACIALLAPFGSVFGLARGGWTRGRIASAFLQTAAVTAAVILYVRGENFDTRAIAYEGRGFFGTIRVIERKARTAKGEGCIRDYIHGSTVHGIQVLIPGKEKMPTTYYTPNACGYGIVAHPKYRKGEPMRVNIVGLGVGTQMSYGRKGDYYRAYEISEDALRVAMNTNLFTFVSGCEAEKDIVLGDARKGLEAELAAGVEPYDVICVDAFTGDNLPYHLSTVEAFELYFRLLKPDGIIVVNISNWHLDLDPFMRALGDHFDCPLLGLKTDDNYATLQFAARAACFCRQPDGMANPPFGDAPDQARFVDFSKVTPMKRLPTDEKGSFLSLVRWLN